MDEEKKVEAVRDFYENAVGDDVAVERLQAVGIKKHSPSTQSMSHFKRRVCQFHKKFLKSILLSPDLGSRLCSGLQHPLLGLWTLLLL